MKEQQNGKVHREFVTRYKKETSVAIRQNSFENTMSFYEIHSCRFPIPDRHKKDRVDFANAFLDKDAKFWRKVIFADHMRFR